MSIDEELFAVAEQLEVVAEYGESREFTVPIQARVDVANEVGKSHSRSWLGYQSCVYQKDLQARPGAHFDISTGLRDVIYSDSRGEWIECDREKLKAHIIAKAGATDLSKIEDKVKEAKGQFANASMTALSILESYLSQRADAFLERIKEKIEKLKPVDSRELLKLYAPRSQILSSDMVAIQGGITVPPHMEVIIEMAALGTVFEASKQASQSIKQAAAHMKRQTKAQRREERIGTNVFIGHGRSPLWREMKDFIVERMRLPADEFNRVPVAGIMNVARLSEMLDSAAVAFLIMTAEDETVEGKMQARMNVIHEVGLFQGRLGFSKAIIMLEDGCEEFSNVQGLGQIRFPKGNIAASFEQVREVLEREGLAG